MNNLMVEIDESIFGEDFFNEQVLDEFSAVFGDDVEAAKAAAEAAMAEQIAAAPVAARRQRKRRCPVVCCPSCAAELCVVQASSSGATTSSPSAQEAKSVSKARVVGALALLQSKAGAPVAPSRGAPKALVQTGNSFSGACPNCGTNLDLTVAVRSVPKTPAPMTVQQVLGDDVLNEAVLGDDVLNEAVLGEILSDLVGDAPKVAEKPDWQKYVDLAAQLAPALTQGIADATKKGPVAIPSKKEDTASREPPPKPQNFLMQDYGPMPLWGWGAALAVVGVGYVVWKKSKKAG